MFYLGLCAIARDETPYLEEWVRFHAWLGAEHFILYDNQSAVPIAETLAPYVEAGLVTVVPAPGVCPQRQAYEDCLSRFGPQHRWIGFLDLDEFAVPVLERDLRSLLSEYEPYAGLVANWVTYGSCGHDAPPPGNVVENYPLACPDQDCHVKCFVDPSRVSATDSPHYFLPEQGSHLVNENLLPVHGNHAPHARDKIRINHYFYRSRQDFRRKIDRWGNNHHGMDENTLLAVFEDQLARCSRPDPAALETSRRARAATLQDLLALRPGKQHLYRYMEIAGELVDAGQAGRAQAVLAHAWMHFPQDPDLTLMRAGLAMLQKRLDWAEKLLRGLLQREFEPEAYLMLGELAAMRANQDELRGFVAYLETVEAMHRAQDVALPESFLERLEVLREKAGRRGE